MLRDIPAFSGIAVDDLDVAKDFYCSVLGLELLSETMGLRLRLGGGGELFLYEKPGHRPAEYTVLNFVVPNIDHAVSELKQRGVQFTHYKDLNPSTDILRGKLAGRGPDIAWFTDPAGNILAVLES